MIRQVWESGKSWQTWGIVILVSTGLHGLLLGSALWWSVDAPRPRRVVPVEAICLTSGSGHAGGGATGANLVKPQPALQPPPPKPRPVKKKARPGRVKLRPQPKVEEPPLPPALTMPRPSAPAAPRPSAAAAMASRGSGSGRGQGAGSGQGSGRGTGPGSGLGAGSGPGTHPGLGSGAGNALKSYLAEVRRLLERQKNYPWMARRQHQEGVVVLKFTIGRGGEIAGQSISRSSGHEVLDQAAAKALKKVGRFPPLPSALGRSRLNIQVPLAFRLRDY